MKSSFHKFPAPRETRPYPLKNNLVDSELTSDQAAIRENTLDLVFQSPPQPFKSIKT